MGLGWQVDGVHGMVAYAIIESTRPYSSFMYTLAISLVLSIVTSPCTHHLFNIQKT